MATIIRPTSQKGQYYLARYQKSTCYSVMSFYSNPSQLKIDAERSCRECMCNEDGKGYKILGGNIKHFICGWETEDGLRVETRCGSYLIPNNE